MNNGIKYVLAFAAGGAIGATVAWKLLKNKYEQIAREEIESVKEVYSKNDNDFNPVEEYDEPENLEESASELAAKAKDKPGIMEYGQKLKEAGYISYANISNSEEVADVDTPYVITPDEFGEIDEYETADLIYYADGVLADDMDELVDDIESTVGNDSLKRIGEYEPDIIHVRNDRLRTDYEIAADLRKFSDLANVPPHLQNNE